MDINIFNINIIHITGVCLRIFHPYLINYPFFQILKS